MAADATPEVVVAAVVVGGVKAQGLAEQEPVLELESSCEKNLFLSVCCLLPDLKEHNELGMTALDLSWLVAGAEELVG